MSPFEFFPHTADIGVALSGASLDEIFAAAFDAFVEILTDRSRVRPVDRWRMTLAEAEPDLLLLEWLSHLLYEFDAHGRLPARAALSVTRAARSWHLDAAVEGEAVDPVRHPIKILIKAVTYHELGVERTGNGWRGRVIFDV